MEDPCASVTVVDGCGLLWLMRMLVQCNGVLRPLCDEDSDRTERPGVERSGRFE